jgi:hypothetical protein
MEIQRHDHDQMHRFSFIPPKADCDRSIVHLDVNVSNPHDSAFLTRNFRKLAMGFIDDGVVVSMATIHHGAYSDGLMHKIIILL